MIRDILLVFVDGQYGTVQDGWKLLKHVLANKPLQDILEEILSRQTIKRFLSEVQSSDFCNQLYQKYREQGVTVLFAVDDDYPETLLHMSDPPLVLFCKGNINLLRQKRLGVLGNAAVSLYGERLLHDVVLKTKSCFVVSMGGQVGEIVGEYALKNHQSCIGVIQTGLDRFYPLKHMFLQRAIARNGLICTDRPFGTHVIQPIQRQYELLVGLSSVLCVVETKKSDATMYAAYATVEQSKDVLIAPANIFEEIHNGNNTLLQMGATLYVSTQDIQDCLENSRV